MRNLRQYFKNFFNTHEPSDKVRRQAYERITLSLNKAFTLPSLNTYSQSLSLKGLLIKSVEMFVGSRAVPKNLELSRHLMSIAEQKAKTDKEKQQIEYYKAFFLRIDAFKSGKTQQFDLSSEMLTQLAEESQHPQSCYLTGKQLFNMAMMSNKQDQRKNMIQLSTILFEQSITDTQFGGLFYLGEIFKNKDFTKVKGKDFRQFFVYGAAMGDPLCYFKMSQIYKEEGKKELYLKYLKLAAETGIIEAQHNLACQYLEGNNFPKDQVKALSWFIHAGANGFLESKYNVAYMFMVGSECGRVKANRKAALLYLQELKQRGEPVQKKIKELVEAEERELQLQS